MTKKVIKMTKMTNLDKFKLLEIRFLHKKQVIRFLGFLDLNFKQFKFKLRFGLKASKDVCNVNTQGNEIFAIF